MLKSTRDVIGRAVLTQDGREIGTVEALLLQVEEWAVRSIEVRLRRDALEALHLKRPLFGTRTVHVGVEHVAGVTDAVVLKLDMERLAALLADVGTEEVG